MDKITIDDLAVIIKGEFEKTNKEIGLIKSDVSSLKSDVNSIKSQMVTKSYLDEKMADQRGDLVVLMRKEDNKLKTLIEILKERKLITDNDEQRILAMEPFPELKLHIRAAK